MREKAENISATVVACLFLILLFVFAIVNVITNHKTNSETTTEEVDLWRCWRVLPIMEKTISDWVATAEEQCQLLQEEWCPQTDCEYLKSIKVEWPVDRERMPGDITEDWTHQVIPTFEVTEDSHKNFINFINKFNSNIKPSDVRAVENHYGLKEGVVACIAFAETSMWTKGYWQCNNVWNVGNNDRWNRNCYATVQGWLEAIGYTLNNQNLWDKQTLGCLSKAWSCTEPNDNWKVRASSTSTREANMKYCLQAIYQQEVNPSTFIIRR
mgnify:CR=1 FL=1